MSMTVLLEVIKSLNDYGMLDLLGILVSPVVSFLILFITLKHEKKQFDLQMQQTEEEHKKTIQVMTEEHNEVLQQQRETNRIAAMPYLVMKKEVSTYMQNDSLYFEIPFSNQGNGTAIGLTGKYIDKVSERSLAPLCESAGAIYDCACPFDYETNIVQQKNECKFTICQHTTNKEIDVSCGDVVVFSLLFRDMYFNQYQQTFKFTFRRKSSESQVEILTAFSYTPELTKLITDEENESC